MRYILFLFLMFVVSCSDNNSLWSRLCRIQEIMDANPQAAYDSLCVIKKTQNITSAKNVDMKWRMLMAMAQNKLYMQMPTDSVFAEVVSYYDSYGSDNEKMQSLYLMGCIYRDMNDAPKAIECFNNIIERFGDSDNMEGYKLLSLAYGQKADLLCAQLLLRKSIVAYDSSILYAKKCKDSILLANNYNYKSLVYTMLDMYDSAIFVNKMSADILLALNKKEEAAIVYGCNMINFYRKKDFLNLKKTLDVYEANSGLFHEGKIEKGRELFYYYKASYYQNVGMFDSVSYYLYEGLLSSNDYISKHAAADGLVKMYSTLGDKDSVVKYLALTSTWADSLSLNKETEQSAKNEALFSYKKYRKDAMIFQTEKQNVKFVYRTTMIFVGFVVLVGFFYFRTKTRKKMWRYYKLLQKMKQYSNDSKSAADKEMIENIQLKTVNQNLLNKKSIAEAEKIVLQKKIDEYIEEAELSKVSNSINKIDEKIFASPIYGVVYDYSQKGKSLNDGIFTKLIIMMDTIIPSFRIKVNSGGPLTKLEYVICILVRMHFRPVDISSLLDITAAALSMKRKRMLKKIYDVNGAPKDFDLRIRKIY